MTDNTNLIWKDYRPAGLMKHELIAWALTEVAAAIQEHTAALREIDLARVRRKQARDE
jgi:hypothetical protein